MLKIILSLLMVTITSIASAEEAVYAVDTTKTKIEWTGSKRVGDDHSGVIAAKSGMVKVVDGKPVSGKIIINMETIKNTDISNEKMSAKLVGHLKSADFFDVANYKESFFVFSQVKDMGNGQYSLEGEMTIRGETNKETVILTFEMGSNGLNAVADLDIDRTKYGVMYNSEDKKEWAVMRWFKGGKDKVIKNNLDIKLNIVATKQ